ncbi:alpha-amylase family protein [Bacillus sp. FJAT-26390]|uniref:alpha-amylase family protein n=1 Tax=Bacillus sp. FJAT-26390 TaxID=1743142 RepID=UPI000807B6F5|nr:alpha-amylase family protein [Bacillus sp. FJAT-26390]OBZ08616.1 glycoside hydrolase [Bacillus sp. FJAT-26390]
MSMSTIIFYDPSFPLRSRLSSDSEGQLVQIGNVVRANALGKALRDADGGCFVNMHAPYFPKEAWVDILAYLKRGGSLINIGGAPFKYPVTKNEDGAWETESEQTAYHRELHIHEALPVDAAPIKAMSAHADIPLLQGKESLFEVSNTWNLVPHVTKTSDLPHQMGSAGPMDAHLFPLLKGVSAEDREVAAPIVLWENTKGMFAGGRWLFVNQPLTEQFWQGGGAEELRRWTAFCGEGVTELWLKPNYASFEPGERAMLTLQAQKLSRSSSASPVSWSFSIVVQHDSKPEQRFTTSLQEDVASKQLIVRIPVPLELVSGYYSVECKAESSEGEVRFLRQGFWGFDRELLAEGSPITAERDYFMKDGRPMPVVGMTYMTSDVARKFLFLPNASVWERDMAQMRKAGINWIRTGIWTAYRNVMQVDGHASEEALRAIDAFLLTAKRNDLQVTFTFFSFTPETWEGQNPYLDPRSVEAQKRFIRAIVSRHSQSKHVDWDLINEPSMFDPPRIFSDGPRSTRDPFEKAAYAAWLKERHGSITKLQKLWNMTPEQLPSFESAVPPEPEEINFDVQDMHQGKKGTRWLDYVLFSMDMHNRWAQELYAAIKEECPDHMVTVGQDEALGAQRPSPFFYGEAVDYTTVHSWWLNDQLVWDSLFAKTAGKPNLVQETGIMYVETPEGRAKRSEAELRNILERKYAYAFATGGAGAVQWIWNTNFYMDNANESHIGALRADGTEKPEANVSYDFGRFMEEIRDLFKGRELEDTAVVFPYSNDFSNRKLAFDATTKATRVLAYELNKPFRGASEYHLEELEANPVKLVIVPSAHNIDDTALERLLGYVERTGATLLLTGPTSLDAYWRPVDRHTELFGARELVNVLREEQIRIGDRVLPVSYGSRRIAQVWKEAQVSDAALGSDQLIELAHGKGRIIWSPLPVELNDRIEPISALYQYALASAGCSEELEWIAGGQLPGVYGRKLTFQEVALYVFVSEYSHNADIEVKDPVTGIRYSFALEKERSVLFAVDKEGQLLAVYRPDQVGIAVS